MMSQEEDTIIAGETSGELSLLRVEKAEKQTTRKEGINRRRRQILCHYLPKNWSIYGESKLLRTDESPRGYS
jgi:hypothetical protein